jgi:hypothetical protein
MRCFPESRLKRRSSPFGAMPPGAQAKNERYDASKKNILS